MTQPSQSTRLEVISLADEERANDVVLGAVLGLWDVVNNLTRLRRSRRDRYQVTIFGSARATPGSFAYEETKRAAAMLPAMGCDIVTGGGPGLMQSAVLEARAAEMGEPFVPFDIDADYRRYVDGKPRLGNGCSMCAMLDGKSVATTMGFTALEGLPMGTRSGAVDPGGVILYLLTERGMSVADVTDLLYHRSGLLGVSGISNDMRTLLASHAREVTDAIDLFVYRISRELGSLAAALGGLDVLVFTAGIGEHAAPVRARVCENAAWLGLRLDPTANLAGGPRITTADSRISAWVIPTNEELMIARHTLACIRP